MTHALLLIAVLLLAPSGCAHEDPARPAPLAQDDVALTIEASLRAWYAALARSEVGPLGTDQVVAHAPFDFALEEGAIRSPDALQQWLRELRTDYPRVAYEIGGLESEALDEDHYRVSLQLDRVAIDGEGTQHVARYAQQWLVRERAGATPAVVSIDEQRLLVFEGTGPQIICY